MSAEGAARALNRFAEEAEPGEQFGEWLAKNCIIHWDRAVPLGRSNGSTFHERKAARIAARARQPSKSAAEYCGCNEYGVCGRCKGSE